VWKRDEFWAGRYKASGDGGLELWAERHEVGP
jgi:hypothetical protein